jgi:hypothetical protein
MIRKSIAHLFSSRQAALALAQEIEAGFLRQSDGHVVLRAYSCPQRSAMIHRYFISEDLREDV